MIKVRFYSHLRRVLATRETDIEAVNVGDLIDTLTRQYGAPFTEKLPYCKVYLNGANVGLGKGRRTRLRPGDEVVFLPPVAGG